MNKLKNATYFVFLLALVAIAGCGQPQSSLSKEDEQNFKGKPMPDDVRRKMMSQSGSAGAPSAPPSKGQ